MGWIKGSKGQAFAIVMAAALLYFILARPAEPVTDFEVEGDLVYVTAGPVGLRILDASDPQSPLMIGAVDGWGYAYALAYQDRTIYVADGAAGVMVVDARDPKKPVKVRTQNTDAAAVDIAVWKDMLYVAVGRQGLQAFRISGGQNLAPVKEAHLEGNFNHVVAQGDRLFTVQDNRTLAIYNLADNKPAPQKVTSYAVGDDVNGIAVEGERVYLAADGIGFLGLDISNPASIQTLVKYDTPGRAMGVAMSGAYLAYVADGKSGLIQLDLQDPANPRPLEVFNTWGNTTQVAIKNDLVYLADGFSGLRILYADIFVTPQKNGNSPQSNTSDLEALSRYVYVADGERGLRVFDRTNNAYTEVNYLDTSGPAIAIDVRQADNRAFLADKESLMILDISNPAEKIKQIGVWEAGKGANIQDVKVVDHYAYLAQGTVGGLSIIDVSNPLTPTRSGKEFAGNALALDVFGDYAYVASGADGLNLVNIVDKELPTRISTLPTTGQGAHQSGSALPAGSKAQDVAVARPLRVGAPVYVYVAAGKGGLCSVNVSDPDRPSLASCFKTAGNALTVAVMEAQGRAYVGDDKGNLYAVLIDDPAHLIQLGKAAFQVPKSAPLYQVTMQGYTAFLAAHERGFRVVDFTNVQNPGYYDYDYPPRVTYFTVAGNYAYALDGELGMRVLDMSNKSRPQELGSLRLTGKAYMLQVVDQYAYVANGQSGLQVVNISNPRLPRVVGGLRANGQVMAVYVRNKTAYIANGTGGLLIADVSDPTHPNAIGGLKDGLKGNALWVGLYRDDYIFLALQGSGLASIYLPSPTQPVLVSTYKDVPDIQSFTMQDKYLYVAAGQDGLVILNGERPRRIEKISQVEVVDPKSSQPGRPVKQVALYGLLAFLSEGDDGVHIYNCTNLKRLRPAGETFGGLAPKNAMMSWVAWEPPKSGQADPGAYWLYVADDSRGMGVFYARHSSHLVQMAVYETPGTAAPAEIFNLGVQWLNEQWKQLGFLLQHSFLPAGIGQWVEAQRVHVASRFLAFLQRFGFSWPQTGISPKAVWTVQRVFLVDLFLLGLVGLVFWETWAAQYTLPVRGLSQRWTSAKRLWAFSTGKHGLLARVKDGKLSPAVQAEQGKGPGVILVDLASAVVLHKRVLKRSLILETALDLLKLNRAPKNAPLGVDRCGQPLPLERAVGPGLVFTGGNAPLRGPKFDEIPDQAVDLHPQIRTEEITAATRDGIEIRTRVLCLFTLGQEPDVLSAAYQGGMKEHKNLRVVELQEIGKKDGKPVKKIKGFSDDLDPEDALEIHHFVSRIHATGALPPAPAPADGMAPPPYLFDAQRVFEAAGLHAMKVENHQPGLWTELPLQAAIDVFRSLCMQVSFDEMFKPKDLHDNPFTKIRAAQRRKMSSLGLLSFQYAETWDGQPPQVGDIWSDDKLMIWPVQPLTGPKVLRSRGIKVIYSGFTDVLPVSGQVGDTLLDQWRSTWESKAQLTHEDYDLRARRIRSGAHARAQNEMIVTLSKIFAEYPNSREALALQLFLALEAAAVDPKTRQLLPAEVFEVIKTIRAWLVDDDGPPATGAPGAGGSSGAGGSGAGGSRSTQSGQAWPTLPPD